jgi:undecaprenyl diphosphate synthase
MGDTPKHVAVIMDGNGRWAQGRGLPRLAGHEAGSKSIERCVQACIDTGVEYLTLYAFSSENWKRPALEVNGLMLLLEKFLNQKRDEMVREGIRLHHIGRIQELPAACQRKLREVMDATASNTRLHLILALNYSGRAEIVDVVKLLAADAARGAIQPDDITPELFASRLNTAGIPDPDLLIRTSGEMRISNFLLWQLSYTEIHVTKKLWPDFHKEDFLAALEDYQSRSRRYGGIVA